MIRRLQLLPAEGRSSGGHLAAMGERIRDGLLRDNKVVPAVLGLLALLIFTWLIAGAIIGGSGEEEETASQSSLAQGGQDSDSGRQETPAPGVENRDTDSYSAFESKDPFRSLVPKADEDKAGNDKVDEDKAGEGKDGEPKDGEPKDGEPKDGEPKDGEPKDGQPKDGEPKDSTPPGGDRPGATPPGGDRPSATPPGEDRPGSVSGGPRSGAPDSEGIGDQPVLGDPNLGGGDPQGAPGQNGNGNLFNSGGDLPTP